MLQYACMRILTMRLQNGNNSLSSSWQTTVNGRLPVPVTLVNNTLIESLCDCDCATTFRGSGELQQAKSTFTKQQLCAGAAWISTCWHSADEIYLHCTSDLVEEQVWLLLLHSNLICCILQTSTPVDFWTQIEMQLSSSVLHACSKVQPSLWTPYLQTWLYMVMPLKGYFWSPCTCLPKSPLLVSHCQHPP